jgi:glycosyltransferase involved in cell wall biosynthesis
MKTLVLAADRGDRLLNPYLRMIFGAPRFLRHARVRGVLLPAGARNLHLHWPEYLLHGRLARRFPLACDAAYRGLLLAMDRVRRDGGRVIWTAHNLAPHGYPAPHAAAAYQRWSREIFARVDTVVAMSPSGVRAVREALSDLAARFEIVPHPHYRAFYGAGPGTQRARHGIPAGAHLACAAGLIRGYKRIPELVAAFAACARADEYLLVAGPCHEPALRAEVERAARRCPRVRLAIGALGDADFAGTIRSADLFVANFAALLNSGSVIAALSLDTPVLAPRLGALADLQAQVGAGWLDLYDGVLDPLRLRLALDRTREGRPEGRPDLAPNDPDRVIDAHLALYA